MAAPGLPAGHSFFAYGECNYKDCTRVLHARTASTMAPEEIVADLKWRMAQHVVTKHKVYVTEETVDMTATVFSATDYDAPDRVVYKEVPGLKPSGTPAPPPPPPPPPFGIPHPASASASASASERPAAGSPGQPEEGRHAVDVSVAREALEHELAMGFFDHRGRLNLSDLSDQSLSHLLLMVSAEVCRRASITEPEEIY